MLALANKRVGPGGLIVVAGAKNSGIEAIARMLAKANSALGKEAKNHAVVVWGRAPFYLDETADAVLPGHGMDAPTGAFSPLAADPASELLLRHLPEKLSGDVADFCAGWGYLALNAATKGQLNSLTLVDSHWHALEAAKRNLAHLTLKTRFLWLDLTTEKVPGLLFDTVIMNPPFHDALGNHAPQLGQACIRAAAKALKPGGRLFMVANRQLPYEATLGSAFKAVEKLADSGGFKLIMARE
jgi:16S rRNA (guanine1207-N2)-methyltransferase